MLLLVRGTAVNDTLVVSLQFAAQAQSALFRLSHEGYCAPCHPYTDGIQKAQRKIADDVLCPALHERHRSPPAAAVLDPAFPADPLPRGHERPYLAVVLQSSQELVQVGFSPNGHDPLSAKRYREGLGAHAHMVLVVLDEPEVAPPQTDDERRAFLTECVARPHGTVRLCEVIGGDMSRALNVQQIVAPGLYQNSDGLLGLEFADTTLAAAWWSPSFAQARVGLSTDR